VSRDPGKVTMLANAITTFIGAPPEYRTAILGDVDRLLDSINGVKHETLGAQRFREHMEEKAEKRKRNLS